MNIQLIAKLILFFVLIYGGCQNSILVNTESNIIPVASPLNAVGNWSFQILYVPEPDPNPSFPVPLSNAKIYIEKVGAGIVSDTLITASNGTVSFNVMGQYNNGEYIIHALHNNKGGIPDLGGHKFINYTNSPAGVYGTIICAGIDLK